MRRGHVSVTVLIVHYSLDVRALFSSQETEIVHTCEVLIETFDAVMTEANTFRLSPDLVVHGPLIDEDLAVEPLSRGAT